MRIERVPDTPGNLEAGIGLIDEASAWLKAKDTDQWAEPWPSRPGPGQRVRRDLAAGKTWFVRDRGTLAATVTVAEGAIPHVWEGGDADPFKQAVYVHRLVTARGYSGLGLGAQLIDWAGRHGQIRYRPGDPDRRLEEQHRFASLLQDATV